MTGPAPVAALHRQESLLAARSKDFSLKTIRMAPFVKTYQLSPFFPPGTRGAEDRFRAFARLKAELEEAKSQLEERKLVDRAKGILMRSLQIPEEEAFGLLRRASMHEQQRVGLVSRRVIDDARDNTEAVG